MPSVNVTATHKFVIVLMDQTEPYGVGLFGQIETINPLTKKFSVFK